MWHVGKKNLTTTGVSVLWYVLLRNIKVTDLQSHVVHQGCLQILCWRLGVPFDLKNVDTLVAIMEQHLFLGMTERGGYRSAGIDYSEGEMNKRWLTTLSRRKDSAKFLFKYKSGKHDWALQRYPTSDPSQTLSPTSPNYFSFLTCL
jgi:hypothetical protein